MTRSHRYMPVAALLVSLVALAPFQAGGIEEVFRYTDLPEVREFVAQIKREHGLSSAGIMSVLRRARKRQDVLDLVNNPAEKTLTWPQYRGIFIQPGRVRAGIAWGARHRRVLDQISAADDIPASIILSIVGVETYYGKHTGKYPVYESLTTLAFEDNRRQSFFRSELREFFLMAHEQKLNPLGLYGSYAGALGLAQFIPSSYRRWAVDFDKDGVTDLINSPADAMASIANYLAVHGWQKDLGVAWPVRLARAGREDELERWRKTQKPKKTVQQWIDAGVVEKTSLPAELKKQLRLPVALIHLPGSDKDQYWLGSKNFYAITRYNHSNLYAMAVFELAGLIETGAAGVSANE